MNPLKDDPHDSIVYALENATMMINSRNYRGAVVYLKLLYALVFLTCIKREREEVGIPIIHFPYDKDTARKIGDQLKKREYKDRWWRRF